MFRFASFSSVHVLVAVSEDLLAVAVAVAAAEAAAAAASSS